MDYQYDTLQLTEAATIFQALADAPRLKILVTLAQGPNSVGDLTERLDERTGTVSARLKVLLQARLVTRRRQGQSVIYSIADDHVLQLIANALEHANEHI